MPVPATSIVRRSADGTCLVPHRAVRQTLPDFLNLSFMIGCLVLSSQALAGRVSKSKIEGEITYNGASQKTLADAGIKLKLLSNYIDQMDVHVRMASFAAWQWAGETEAANLCGHLTLLPALTSCSRHPALQLPYLTVRETAEFACFNSTVRPCLKRQAFLKNMWRGERFPLFLPAQLRCC